jgi:hypothetical protein
LLVGETTFSSNSIYTYAAFDADNTVGFKDTTSTTCYIGMGFTVGHVGIVSEVKFFMNTFLKETYSGNLIFQGSSDNIKYTDLFTVGDEIHEGWNYKTYTDATVLKYRYYRFKGTEVGACNMGELVLWGVEAINDSASSHTCAGIITINGTASTLSAPIIYTSSLTPLLNSISPRYGNV